MNGLSRAEWITLAAGIVVIILILWVTSLSPQSSETQSSVASAPALGSGTSTQNLGPNISTTAGLEEYDVKVGTGTEAQAGDTVMVNYVGTLQDGTVFDSSSAHGGAISIPLTPGGIIQGWYLGVPGMKVGGERELVISPQLGYGAQQVGQIPANSTLIFDIQLVGVTPAK